MKKNFLSWLFISLFMAAGLSACDDDDDDDNIVVAFPEKLETITANAGETKQISFKTSAAWTLTSSELWCTFGKSGEYSLSGTAGEQTVSINVSDLYQSNAEKSVAHLTLGYGDQTAIIADVERNASGFELIIKDAEGNVVESIEAGYDEYKEYTFESNFRFAATNRPEWVELDGGSIVGGASTPVKGGVKFASTTLSAKYSIGTDKGYTLTISDENGLYSQQIPVSYAGMDPMAINWEGPAYFTWEVTLDGKTFMNTSSTISGDGNTSTGYLTYKDFVPFTISALNDEIVPVYLEKWMDEWSVVNPNWEGYQKLTGEEGNMKLTVAEAWEERELAVMVFPKALYDKLVEETENDIITALVDPFDAGAFAYRYEQNNLLIQFTQKEIKQGGGEETGKPIIVRNGGSYQLMDVTKVDSSDERISFLEGMGMYGLDKNNVYEVNVYPEQFLIVAPQLDGSVWNPMEGIGGTYDTTYEIMFEPTEDYEYGSAVMFSVPSVFPEYQPNFIAIAFHDNMWSPKAALIMNPIYE